MTFSIYLICLGVGFLFTIIGVMAGHLFGGDHGHVDGSGGHAEAGVDMSDMPGVSALSPTIISAFVTSFGAFGVILSQFEPTKAVWISAPLSILGGFGVAACILTLLRTLFRKTQSSSESKVGQLVGVIATVITPIPENGVGEIAYVQAGTRYTAPARVESGATIPNGLPVKITRVVGTQYYVERA